MKVNRIVKWAAAGALALGVIPALGMARSHASLPTSNVTVTPTSLEAPIAPKAKSRITHSAKTAKVSKASVHSHKSTHHRKTGTATKHKSHTASHHAKTVSSHKKTSTASKKKLTSSKTHKPTASKKPVIKM